MSNEPLQEPTWDQGRAEQMLRALRAGANLEDAAAFARIQLAELRAWVEWGEDRPASEFGMLLVSMRKAKADLRVANLAQVLKSANEGDAKAARFMLDQLKTADENDIRILGRPEHRAAPSKRVAPHLAIPGKAMCIQIRHGKLTPDQLTKEQRKQCVLWLESRGMTRVQMAAFLGVSDRQLLYDLKELGQELEDGGYDLSAILGWIFRTVDAVQSLAKRVALKAEQEGEFQAAASSIWKCWRAIKEYVDTLQSLGVLPKAAEKVEIDIQVKERVKVVFAVVVDAIAAELKDRPDLQKRITDRVGRQLGEHVG